MIPGQSRSGITESIKCFIFCCRKRYGRERRSFKRSTWRRIQKEFWHVRGKEQSVKLLVENSLAGVIVDRFGKDVMMIPADADHFTVSVDVQVSSQFISWVFALGSQQKLSARRML